MRAAVVVMQACNKLIKEKPIAYLSYQVEEDGYIKHLIVKLDGERLRLKILKVACHDCFLYHTMKKSKLLSMPSVQEGGDKLKFVVMYTSQTKNLIDKYRDRIESFEVTDLRGLLLTKRQREVLSTAALRGPSPSRIAKELGISRQAAQKLIAKALKKLTRIL